MRSIYGLPNKYNCPSLGDFSVETIIFIVSLDKLFMTEILDIVFKIFVDFIDLYLFIRSLLTIVVFKPSIVVHKKIVFLTRKKGPRRKSFIPSSVENNIIA